MVPHKGIICCEEPCGRDRRASEIEYLFPVSFPLVGNPSDCPGSKKDPGQARMTEIRNCGRDHRVYNLLMFKKLKNHLRLLSVFCHAGSSGILL